MAAVAGGWLALVRGQLCCDPAAGRAPKHAHPASSAAAAARLLWVAVAAAAAWGWEVLVSEAAGEARVMEAGWAARWF